MNLPAELHFISENIKRLRINEFLLSELRRSGYGGMEIQRTPLGTRIAIYAERPGMVIGGRGKQIKRLTKVLEEEFKIENPQLEVREVEVPELNAMIMAQRIASALERGMHFRRVSYTALKRIMDAGAKGAEIIISGKISGERARYEKFREGHIRKCGEAAENFVLEADVQANLKPGIVGVVVRIMPPYAVFPDEIKLKEQEQKVAQITPVSKPEEAQVEAVAESEKSGDTKEG
ncbi:MAG: 30S ribosomal protein S3 [Euryarchaeota archaeon]|nr:30S ribosomal protein S3 [Euryarchaeota archaeon]